MFWGVKGERERERRKETKKLGFLTFASSLSFFTFSLSQFAVPRLGYLPTVADRALDAFRNVLSPLALVIPRAASSGSCAEEAKTSIAAEASSPSSSSSSSSSPPAPWFSETGDPAATPLRWHFPVGVLADAALARKGIRSGSGSRGGRNEVDGDSDESHSSLSSSPWPLTIHFSRYPASVLPPWRVVSTAAGSGGGEKGKRTSSASSPSISSPALREAYFNSLKEASCAATGSAARVLAMPGAASERLWAAAESGDAEAATAVVSRTFSAGSSGGGEENDEGGCPFPSSSAFVPLRLTVVAPASGESLRDPHCTFEVVSTSRPVAKSSRRGEEEKEDEEETETAATTTLGQALLQALPKLLGGGGGGADSGTPAWTFDPSSSGSGGGLLLRGKSAKVLVAGLEVGAAAKAGPDESSPLPLLLAAPLAWVHARLAACDQFLYVVVRAPEPL